MSILSGDNPFYAKIDEGINDPGIFKAVFIAGGPGSGKSFIVGKTALTSLGLVLINSDDAFESQLRKVGLTTKPEDIYSELGQSVRGRAKELTGKKQKLAVEGRLGLVIDGTGKDFDKIKSQGEILKKLGYDISLIFVNTDIDTAQARNAKRQRTLPAAEVDSMWQAVQKNIGKFQNYFGNDMFIVDNSEGSNWEAVVLSTYRKVMSWVKRPVQNHIAKKWIEQQKQERGITEKNDLF